MVVTKSEHRKTYTFYIDTDLAEGLKEIKERVGISESEQIRRAIRQWLDSQRESQRANRSSTRKR